MKITLLEDLNMPLDFDEKNKCLIKCLYGGRDDYLGTETDGKVLNYLKATGKKTDTWYDDYVPILAKEGEVFSVVSNTYDEKLVNFFKKIYPNNEIVVDKDYTQKDIPRMDYIITDMLCSVDGTNFDHILGLEKGLTPFEMEELLLTLNKSKYSSLYDIFQIDCSTCKERGLDKHLEIAYNFTE